MGNDRWFVGKVDEVAMSRCLKCFDIHLILRMMMKNVLQILLAMTLRLELRDTDG